jgi:pentatricopeptide repeat protein
MLRQLLSISPALRLGWRSLPPADRARFGSAAAAELASAPGVDGDGAAPPPPEAAPGGARPSPGYVQPLTSTSAASASASHPARPRVKSWKWLFQLRQAANAGNADGCAAILRDRLERSSAASAWTSRAFADALRMLPPKDALRMYQLSRDHGVGPTPTMAVSVVRMHAALGMIRHVEGAVRDMLAAGLKPHWSTFFHWANVHAEAGDAEGVRRAAAAADAAGVPVTAHYQTLMVKALCKSGRTHATLTLLRDVLASGTPPPEPVWRALIHCHGLAGHALRCQAIFDEMRAAGVQAGPSTWSALVNAYAECRMPRQAAATMVAMRAAGVAGNHQTYTSLLKAFAQAGDVGAAQRAVGAMRADGLQPNAHVWGALLSACAVAGDVPTASAAFAEMVAAGWAPGVVQFTSLLSAHRNAGDMEGALRVLGEMDAAGVKPTMETFTEVITLLGQHGLTAQAEATFRAISAQGYAPDQIAYNVLAGALLGCWVDGGRRRGADLALRAEEVYREGWAAGATRPSRYLSPDGRLLRVDLHWQGTWSAQVRRGGAPRLVGAGPLRVRCDRCRRRRVGWVVRSQGGAGMRYRIASILIPLRLPCPPLAAPLWARCSWRCWRCWTSCWRPAPAAPRPRPR